MVQCGANRRPRREGSMREYSIETIDYRIDIADRIRRALRGAEGVGVRGEGQKAAVITRDGEAREQLCMALCRVLLNDAAAEEIKRELKAYPLEAAEAERAAVRAGELMRRVPRSASLFANAPYGVYQGRIRAEYRRLSAFPPCGCSKFNPPVRPPRRHGGAYPPRAFRRYRRRNHNHNHP